MTWYEKIEQYLEDTNSTGIKVEIDDISETSINFLVYEDNVCDDILAVLEEVILFIGGSDSINLVNIGCYTEDLENNRHNPDFYFNLQYEVKVGEDEEMAEDSFLSMSETEKTRYKNNMEDHNRH